MSNKPPISGKGKGVSSSPKKHAKKKVTPKKKRGQPTKYLPEMAEKAFILCRDCGLTDENLAKCLNVSVRTLQYWMESHEEFLQAIKKGKDAWNTNGVEKSLLKRAMGFEYEEVTREPLYNAVTGDPILDEDGNHRIVVTKIVRKHMAPETAAICFWLKNRDPGRWRDKQEIEHSGKDGGPLASNLIVIPAKMDEGEWQKQVSTYLESLVGTRSQNKE